MYGLMSDILRNIVKAWRGGNRIVRWALVLSATIGLLAAVLWLLAYKDYFANRVALALGVVAFLLTASVSAYQESLDRAESEKRFERVEQRYAENPAAPQAAWDLARVKLEKYLERNLAQVQSIFWLTAVVMTVGFILIGIGVVRVLAQPSLLEPSLLAVISGVLLNFLGATFMMIYRSTMAQASNYVTVLERINAVGMSVQVLESLKDRDDLYEETTAKLVSQLLQLYASTGTNGGVV